MEYYELSVIDSVVRSSVHETSRNTTVSPAKKASLYIYYYGNVHKKQ